MGRKHKRQETEFIEPDLPITPMLDMSFQLMAFFILTFRPSPTEGQLALALPELKGGDSAISQSLDDVKAEDVTVTVDATDAGTIRNIAISDSVGSKPSLGADASVYQKELLDKVAKVQKSNGKLGKLKLELDNNLVQEYVVHLIDIAVRAGFTDISPEPKRPGGAPK